MKKLLLLLAAGSFTIAASAQEKMPVSARQTVGGNVDHSAVKHVVHPKIGKKTTTTTGRWYDYVYYYDTSQSDIGNSIAYNAPYLWNDTLSVDAYSDASGGTVYDHNTTVSMGTILDPSFSGFNDFTYFNGEMELKSTNAYQLDSVALLGVYGFNPAKTSVVDTIRLTFVYGNGGTSDIFAATTTNSVVTTRYGAGSSLAYYNLNYDSVTNKPTGSTVVTRDIILNNSGASPAWGDTLSDGLFFDVVGFSPISIPAGNMVSATFTFKSGDPTFVANDTVFSSTIGYKYNMFRPYVAFRGTSSAPLFAPYSTTNRNTGVFKTLPDSDNGWDFQYIPMWFWSSSATGSRLQFPYINYHITCASCGTVYDHTGVNGLIKENSVKVGPNPADDQLVINYTFAGTTDVTVTLNNMLGQEVAAHNMKQVANGKAVFNTSALPAGLYTYTVIAGGERSTGRIVVAH